jgi:hypothetical protein
MTVDRADLRRRLAAEFDRRGWEYDLSVAPAIIDQIVRSDAVDAVALAAVVPREHRRRLRASEDELANAISRAFSGVIGVGSPSVPGMRLLLIAAGPLDQQRLRLNAEHRDIRSRIRGSTARKDIHIEFAGAARPTDLLDEINKTRPTILHIAGHGDTTGISLEDDAGVAVDVSTEQLKRVIEVANSDLRLVVMNTCESAYQAQPMVGAVDASIGMLRTIGDDAARTFATQLYSSLAEGVSLGRAFEQAKLQISLAGSREDETPALFTRKGVDPQKLVFIY